MNNALLYGQTRLAINRGDLARDAVNAQKQQGLEELLRYIAFINVAI